MRHLTFSFVAVTLLSFGVIRPFSGSQPPDYSKVIVGCWLGPRKFDVYHADGTWGVKRYEDDVETVKGPWRIEGNKLSLTYSGDDGTETATYTIVSCTDKKLILEAQGRRVEYTRYSSSCGTEA